MQIFDALAAIDVQLCPQRKQLHPEAVDVSAASADPGGLARLGCAKVALPQSSHFNKFRTLNSTI